MLGKEGILVENYGRREKAALFCLIIHTLHASEAAAVPWGWSSPAGQLLLPECDLYWMLFGFSTGSFFGPSRLEDKAAICSCWALGWLAFSACSVLYVIIELVSHINFVL